jgi:hypothetical protein
MEVSHRGQAFIDCAAKAERNLRELMAVPDDYHVLFLQGGATTLAALLPLNLAGPDAGADYVLTGHWGEKALENAQPSLRTRVAASSKEAAIAASRRSRPGSWIRRPHSCTTRRTRPSTAWSSITCRMSAMCRSWRISPPVCCRARWTCRASG